MRRLPKGPPSRGAKRLAILNSVILKSLTPTVQCSSHHQQMVQLFGHQLGVLLIQLISDTNYMESAGTPADAKFHNIAFTSDTSCKFRGSQTTRTSDQLVIDLGVFRFVNSLEWLTDLRISDYRFFIEDINEEWSKEETHKVKSGSTPNMKLLRPQASNYPARQCVSLTTKLTWASVSRVFVGSLTMITFVTES